jgi:hypothetical protein
MLDTQNRGGSTKASQLACQYIQGDVSRMRSYVSRIEEMGEQAVSLVPRSCAANLKKLSAKSSALERAYANFNWQPIQAKLNLAEDSFRSISAKIRTHLFADPKFMPSKAYASSFVDDVTSRLVTITKKKLANFRYAVDRRMKVFSPPRETAYTPMFMTEPLQIEMPLPKVIFKAAKPSERANQAILCAIKTQTERLRRIFLRITDLKKMRDVRAEHFNFNWVSQVSESEHFQLLEHKIKAAVIETRIRLACTEKDRQVERREKQYQNAQPDYVEQEELDELFEWTTEMIEKATSEFKRFEQDAEQKVAFLRSKIDMINARLDGFGDFSGESRECMSFLDMKVGDVVDMSGKPDVAGVERERSKRLVERMLKLNYTIEKGVNENAVAELWRKAKRLKWVVPLVSV